MKFKPQDRVMLNAENATSIGTVIRINPVADLPVVVKFDIQEEPFHFKHSELKYENHTVHNQ